MKINRKTFFAEIKNTVGGYVGEVGAKRIAGIDAILDAFDTEGVTDPRWMAYVLATPMIETGETFAPITESLNYSEASLLSKFGKRITAAQAKKYGRNASHAANQEAIGNIIYGGPWGKTNLGNKLTGDGFKYRGRGLVQTTGRRLYEIFGYADNPEAVGDIKISADIMVRGMRDGTFTGKKLSDYFNDDKTDWTNARRIVNGVDRAADIARIAQVFYKALQKSEVANSYELKSSRTIQGAAVSGSGGALVLVDNVQDVVNAVQSHQDAFTTGQVVGIIVGLVAVCGALYALYARWDDAGRPKFWH